MRKNVHAGTGKGGKTSNSANTTPSDIGSTRQTTNNQNSDGSQHPLILNKQSSVDYNTGSQTNLEDSMGVIGSSFSKATAQNFKKAFNN